MRICIVTPVPRRSRRGNRITAARWATLLRELGHRVDIVRQYDNQPCDVLLALHAKRSYRSIARFHQARPDAPLLVALTGTDLYHDLPHNPSARRSLQLATRIIALQGDAIRHLPPGVRSKTRVIHQSATSPKVCPPPLTRHFEVTVIGHLREVKDPFRAAMAARRLPDDSRIRIVQLGAALTLAMARRARAEEARNGRYVWLGDRPRWQTMRRLARSRAMVVSSKLEGGANVLSEAIAVGVPTLASRISGNVGILGENYPGYFPLGDTDELSRLLHQVETDRSFYRSLKAHCRRLAPLVKPSRERAAWRRLLAEIDP